MLRRIHVLSAGVVFFFLSTAQAALTPLGIGFLHKVEFPPEDFTIVGARASVFWGIHRNVYGIDVGAVGNITEQNFVGTAVSGVFNSTHGMTTIVGLQAAGIANVNYGKSKLYGLQLAPVNMNEGEGGGAGVELAIANLSPHTTLTGLQVGVYNRVHAIYGFQVGLINTVDNLHGLQIGLLNFNRQGLLAVSPILNVGF